MICSLMDVTGKLAEMVMMPISGAGNWIDMADNKKKSDVTAFFFTFIELSVVLVIIGILVTVVGPRVWEGMGGRGLNLAVKRIAAVGDHAGNLAATRSQIYVVRFDLRENLFFITTQDQAEREENPAPFEGNIHRLPNGVSISEARLEDQMIYEVLDIRFAPDGWADNAALYLVDDKGNKKTVAFTRSRGKFQIVDDPNSLDF